jgi:hypothetical protein
MLVYFLSSYDAFFFLSLLIAPLFILLILAGPIFVFYWVFRSPNNRESDYKFIRVSSIRLSLVCMVISLAVTAFARSGWLFENQLDINKLFFISEMVAALALLLSTLSLPRLLGFIALFVALVNYLFVWFIATLPIPQINN